jgi:hypothetical protein
MENGRCNRIAKILCGGILTKIPIELKKDMKIGKEVHWEVI